MAKIRVYELGKELGLDNKEIMAKLRSLKIPVKSHMSVVPEEELDRVKKSLAETDEVKATGNIEEKRVAKGVIRRRARVVVPQEVEEAPKMDLVTLKQAAKRHSEEEEAVKTPPEILEDIPEEWAEEAKKSETPEKKPKKTKATAKKSPPKPEERKDPGKDKKTKAKAVKNKKGVSAKKGKTEKQLASAKEEVAGKDSDTAVEETAIPDAPATTKKAGAKAKKARVVPRKMYLKPSLRKTARAPEGEPLPIPGQASPAKPVEAGKEAPEDALSKRKKKKKKGKTAAEDKATPFGEVTPKKKLRRKIAFKMQSGIEGMEIANVEQMYRPSRKKITSKKKVAKKTQITTPKATKRIVKMGETITLADLGKQLGVKSREIIKSLKAEGITEGLGMGMEIDMDTAGVIASTYEYEIMQTVFDEQKLLGRTEKESEPGKQKSRSPVVTVMGHVDHGKTSLLDTIRKTKVAEQEAGQITQHIGASVVETSSGKIVFVDTPGHEAFTVMRARGAKVTDIVVLVVAADDGIMPQTVEAADHAQAAGVPIIVAINKIDIPNANVPAVKQRLADISLAPEEWGGETLVVECSAKTGQGVPELLEAILLQAEMLELTADPDRPGKGLVIESWLDKGRGPIATLVVQEGTFKKGDPILSGLHFGRIKAMLDDRENPIDIATPSMPVEIMGLSNVPEPGEVVMVVDDEKKAKMVAEHRLEKQKLKEIVDQAPAKVSLEELMAHLEEGDVQDLNLILKTDTQGSAEAVKQAVEKISRKEVQVRVIHFGVGNITENDVLLASASNAVIIGFAVKTENSAAKLAEREGVQIRTYKIIYDIIDDVEASLKGMLKPVFEEKVIGKAEVRKIFNITKAGTVAGSYVTEGIIKRSARARIVRGSEVVFSGKFKSLKRIQDDVREVAQGLECGIGIDNFNKILEGDTIEAFELTEIPPE